jgi:hypothetical protein
MVINAALSLMIFINEDFVPFLIETSPKIEGDLEANSKHR